MDTAAKFQALLKKFPSGLLSVVVDSYDVEKFIKEVIGGCCRADVEARNGVVVVRPDSGDPAEMVVKVPASILALSVVTSLLQIVAVLAR